MVFMRRKDGHARALLRLFTLPIRYAFSTGEWVEPDEGDAEEETQFCKDMWDLPPNAGGMEVSKSKFLRQTWLGLADGFAVFEEVRTVPEDGPLKGKIVLKKLAYRDARTIRFVVDDKGNFTGIKQQAAGLPKDISIDGEKIWYWTYQDEENPYYGISLLEAAWHHYDVKRKLYYISHIAAQFAAVPGRMGTVPKNPNVADLNAFRQMLQNFAFNTSGIMKEGYAVQPFNGNTGFDFLKMIDHQNAMMSRSVLAGFLDEPGRPTLIDNASTNPEADMFVMSLEAIMDELAESWSTSLMPKYLDWNFGTKKYPKFKFGQLTDSAKDAIKEVFSTLAVSSVLNTTPELVRELEIKLAERLGLDIDYEEIAAKEEKAAEEAQQAQQDAADAQAQAAADAAAQGLPAPPAADGAPPMSGAPAAPPTAPPVAASAPTITDLVDGLTALLATEETDLAPADDLT